MSRAAVVALTLLAAGIAAAEPRTLRFSTSAPDGTFWARQMRAFASEVEGATRGELHVKWYFGGATGDERQTQQHIRARRVDGMAGAAGCVLLAPALAVTNVVGLFRSRDEAVYVLHKIRPTIDEEMRGNGFTSLGIAAFGIEVLFSRTPIRSLADFQRGNYWTWDINEVGAAHLRAMSIHPRPLSIFAGTPAYDSGQIDGFVAAPSAALGFQWSAQTAYFSDLQIGFATAYLVISNATMDQLPVDQQRALRVAGERLARLFDRESAVEDAALLGHLLERQGLKRVPVDVSFRSEFYEAALATRSALDPKIVPPVPFRRVLDLLADYRAEQRAEGETR